MIKNPDLEKLPIALGLLVTALFITSLSLIPFTDGFSDSLYPKKSSFAEGESHVIAGESFSVPITFSSNVPVAAIDFELSLENAELESITCGGSGYDDTSASTDTRCVIYNSDPRTSGIVGYAVVKGVTAGEYANIQVGNYTMSTVDGQSPDQTTMVGARYLVIDDIITVGDTISAPIICTADTPIAAIDFSVSTSNATIEQLICGGSGFRDSGASSDSNCVVYSIDENGSSGGTVGTVNVKPEAAGTLMLDVVYEMSDADGNTPTNASCEIGTYVVIGITPTPSNVTPTITIIPTTEPTPTPEVTATPSPTPTIPVDGELTLDPFLSPRYENTISLSGTITSSADLIINGSVIFENVESGLWQTGDELSLGLTTFIIQGKIGDEVIGQITIGVNRYGMGDINGNAQVDVFDLGIFAGNYEMTGVGPNSPELVRMSNLQSQDDVIDVLDLGILAGVYGTIYTYLDH